MTHARIIGVDAGGTKTECVSYNANGKAVNRVLKGAGNLLVDFDTAYDNISQAIAECIPNDGHAFIAIGAAGIETGEQGEKLKYMLAKRFADASFCLISDAKLMHYALLQGGDGVLLIAGTGSIAYAKRDTLWKRAGGWGHLLGDEGSGYDIVRRALQVLVRVYDEERPLAVLGDKILRKFGGNIREAAQFIYQTTDKAGVAALLPSVIEAARDNDANAVWLLADAGKALGALAAGLYSRMGYETEISIALKGGVIENVDEVRKAFFKTFDESIGTTKNNVHFVDSSVSATLGAYYISLKSKDRM